MNTVNGEGIGTDVLRSTGQTTVFQVIYSDNHSVRKGPTALDMRKHNFNKFQSNPSMLFDGALPPAGGNSGNRFSSRGLVGVLGRG